MNEFSLNLINKNLIGETIENFHFGSKSYNLKQLKEIESHFNFIVPDLFSFTVKNWFSDKASILNKIKEKEFDLIPVAVRSSAQNEDSTTSSMAGRYTSFLNQRGIDSIIKAIDGVVNSFQKDHPSFEEDEVFLQPMVQNIKISGVLFTHDISTGSPYSIINYDDESGKSDSVTSGNSNSLKTLFYHHDFISEEKLGRLWGLNQVTQELKKITGNEKLDIEFCIDSKDKIYLLQVRPLIIRHPMSLPNKFFLENLQAIHQKVGNILSRHPYLLGEKGILGMMPDWNPAEIIGPRPRPLSLTLYKELITDNIWAYQRNNYGYRNLRSFPLLYDLGGVPFIDVRTSFNSFIPIGLETNLAEKLVNYYLQRLRESPHLHDKVEFEIVFSCFTFDIKEKLLNLKKYNFSELEIDEIYLSLKGLTNSIINPSSGLWIDDLKRISVLEERREILLNSKLDLSSLVFWLIEDCKRYGTLPFAGLARAGFIAVQLLQSLVAKGILSEDERHSFMEGLDTITNKMAEDFSRLTADVFLKKYGHLRPGTYNILSPRYDEEPKRYFTWSSKKRVRVNSKNKINKKAFALSISQLRRIENLLRENGIDSSALELLEFIKEAIEGREYSKFVFTKSLSDILKFLGELGKQYGFSNEDCSYIDIQSFLRLHTSSSLIQNSIKDLISQGMDKFSLTKLLNFPPLILDPDDIFCFHQEESSPNFITQGQVRAGVALELKNKEFLQNRVVFIESADPGYDWIFSHQIKGLVTKFGGVNSHMAIRASELGIPAIIGAGEKLYNNWKNANFIYIDCLNRKVELN